MQKEDYQQGFGRFFSPYLDRVLLFTATVALAMSLLILRGNAKDPFVFIDGFFALIIFGTWWVRNRISINTKVIVILMLASTLMILLFIFHGFSGVGLILLGMVNVVVIAFFSERIAWRFAGASLVLLCVFGLMITNGQLTIVINPERVTNQPFSILVHIATFSVFLIATLAIVGGIRTNSLGLVERLKSESEAKDKIAYYDRLTGLPNWNRFELDLESLFGQELKAGVFCLLNFRDLKQMNSLFGVTATDNAIKSFSAVLTALKQPDIHFCRTTGNEFAIWFADQNHGSAVQWLDSVKTALAMRETAAIRPSEGVFYLAFSEFVTESSSLHDLMQRANITMLFAKQTPEASFLIYDQSLESRFQQGQKLLGRVSIAVSEQAFTPVYQSKVDARTGTITGVEALARWKDTELGVVSPVSFIPAIDRVRLTVPFCWMMMNLVMADFIKIQALHGEAVSISINISPLMLVEDHFAQKCLELASLYNVPPNKVILEITEDSMIAGIEHIGDVMGQLTSMGFHLSLDDFGTGYSSLNHLSILPLSEVKIDKAFIDRILHDTKALAIVQSLIQLAPSFGFDVIAEGVETKEQVDALLSIGCHYIQGYYFSKPQALEPENVNRTEYEKPQ